MVDDDYESLEEALQAQSLINSGLGWHLEGAIGRCLMDFISAGRCCLGHQAHSDYWGNRVPSRDEIKPGTKGSIDFVENQMDDVWAKAIIEVP